MNESIWDFWAPRYERLWVQYFSLGPTRELVLHKLQDILRPGMSLLDMGCGTGQLLREIADQFAAVRLTGADISPKMIEAAGNGGERIRYITAGVDDFSSDACFDVVTCLHSFPYYADKEKSLHRLAGLVADGGYLLLAQATPVTLYDKFMMSMVKLTTSPAEYWSPDRLASALRALCCTVDRYTVRTFPGMPCLTLFLCRKRGAA